MGGLGQYSGDAPRQLLTIVHHLRWYSRSIGWGVVTVSEVAAEAVGHNVERGPNFWPLIRHDPIMEPVVQA